MSTSAPKQFGFWSGTAYAIGSIIGSGILFLPSLTAAKAGDSAIIAWAIGTLICLPILHIFREMLSLIPKVDTVDGFVHAAFGENFRFAMPYLFLSTVALGMPAAALIAGKYMAVLFSTSYTALAVATIIILAGLVCNLYAVTFSSNLNKILVMMFILLSLALLFSVLNKAALNNMSFNFEYKVSKIAPTIVLTFWAFAGFENLTFISKQFRGGALGFYYSCVTALVICGSLYLLLTLSILIAQQDTTSFDYSIGLLSLLNNTKTGGALSIIVPCFAFFAVLVNQISWTKGISSMIARNALNGAFPRQLASNQSSDVPTLSTIVFSCILLISVIIQYNSGVAQQLAIETVSTNFIIIYIISLSAYFKLSKSWKMKLYALCILVALVLSLSFNLVHLIYPTLVLTIARLIADKTKQKMVASK